MTKKAPYRIWTDDLRLTMALLYHTELKGPRLNQFSNKEPANMNMSLVHVFVTAYT